MKDFPKTSNLCFSKQTETKIEIRGQVKATPSLIMVDIMINLEIVYFCENNSKY